jgi:hypothetical protein
VLELRGLAQQVDEFFAILYDDLLGHGGSRSAEAARVTPSCFVGKRDRLRVPDDGGTPSASPQRGAESGSRDRVLSVAREARCHAGPWSSRRRAGIVPPPQ